MSNSGFITFSPSFPQLSFLVPRFSSCGSVEDRDKLGLPQPFNSRSFFSFTRLNRDIVASAELRRCVLMPSGNNRFVVGGQILRACRYRNRSSKSFSIFLREHTASHCLKSAKCPAVKFLRIILLQIKNNVYNRFALLNKHQILSIRFDEASCGNSVNNFDCRAFSPDSRPWPAVG